MSVPTIVKMEVFPVAGHDCMELNLSGAHAPYFTRNIVIGPELSVRSARFNHVYDGPYDISRHQA